MLFPCARHSAKSFIWIISFNSETSEETSEVLLLSPILQMKKVF